MLGLELILCVVIVFRLIQGSVHGDEKWSYSGNTAPRTWHSLYAACGGSRQSPINIVTSDVEVDESLGTLDLGVYSGDVRVNMSLLNNGHSVEVDIHGERPEIRGGGLPGVYKVVQFHFHWGHNDRRGSEHLINDNSFPMEMHIVHYNTEYDSIKEAAPEENGLAVLGFLFEIGDHNYEFDEIINHLIDIKHRSDHKVIHSFSLQSLLPDNPHNFWRYQGSLTTPPCYESVVWTIFKDRIAISEEQLNQFRKHVMRNYADEDDILLNDDYRPVQPLNRRTVHANGEFTSRASLTQPVFVVHIFTLFAFVSTITYFL